MARRAAIDARSSVQVRILPAGLYYESARSLGRYARLLAGDAQTTERDFMGCNMNKIGTRVLRESDLAVLAGSMEIYRSILEASKPTEGERKIIARLDDLIDVIKCEQARSGRLADAIARSYEQHGN